MICSFLLCRFGIIILRRIIDGIVISYVFLFWLIYSLQKIIETHLDGGAAVIGGRFQAKSTDDLVRNSSLSTSTSTMNSSMPRVDMGAESASPKLKKRPRAYESFIDWVRFWC